jgi:hypothetical protein
MPVPEALLRSRIAQLWLALSVIACCGLVMALARDAVANDWSVWAQEPGRAGLRASGIGLGGYLLMALLVNEVSAPWFRWLSAGLAALFGLAVLVHQVAHAFHGGRAVDLAQAFDLLHHAASLRLVLLSRCWARQAACDAR